MSSLLISGGPLLSLLMCGTCHGQVTTVPGQAPHITRVVCRQQEGGHRGPRLVFTSRNRSLWQASGWTRVRIASTCLVCESIGNSDLRSDNFDSKQYREAVDLPLTCHPSQKSYHLCLQVERGQASLVRLGPLLWH